MTTIINSVNDLENRVRVVLYGAGGMGEQVMNDLLVNRPDVDILFFADSYKKGSFHNRPVILGSELPDHASEYDRIIITSHMKHDIRRFLQTLGLEKKLCFISDSAENDELHFNSAPCYGNRVERIARQLFYKGKYSKAQKYIDSMRVKASVKGATLLDSVILLVTMRCNLNCSHCWGNDCFRRYIDSTDEMNSDQIIQVIMEIHKLNPAIPILISGGEACLRTDLYDILLTVSEKGVKTVLLTNGTQPEKISNLLENKTIRDAIVGVAVSVDGPSEVHDRIRARGSLAKTLETIRIFNGYGKKVVIGSVIQTGNMDHLDELFALRNHLAETHDLIVDSMNLEINNKGRYIEADPARVKPFLSDESRFLLDHEHELTGLGCKAGITKCTILPSGHVLACGISGAINGKPYLLGKLSDYNYDFERLWTSSEAEIVRDKIRQCPGCGSFCER
ncbi:MAG: radical SAM protein [Desulfobacteraceae bacterium]|jgi:MoaA/NifB/PqqE/SkfB family radical SAM enzyme